jgi:hypothetical protein
MNNGMERLAARQRSGGRRPRQRVGVAVTALLAIATLAAGIGPIERSSI